VEPGDYATIVSATIAALTLALNLGEIGRQASRERRAQRLYDLAEEAHSAYVQGRLRERADRLVLASVSALSSRGWLLYGGLAVNLYDIGGRHQHDSPRP
jgi:hypothetical protein